MAVPLRRGGGAKGCAIEEKIFFSDGEFPTTIKLKGRGTPLMALPLKKKLFFAASLTNLEWNILIFANFV